jgi:hypothetical protein
MQIHDVRMRKFLPGGRNNPVCAGNSFTALVRKVCADAVRNDALYSEKYFFTFLRIEVVRFCKRLNTEESPRKPTFHSVVMRECRGTDKNFRFVSGISVISEFLKNNCLWQENRISVFGKYGT